MARRRCRSRGRRAPTLFGRGGRGDAYTASARAFSSTWFDEIRLLADAALRSPRLRASRGRPPASLRSAQRRGRAAAPRRASYGRRSRRVGALRARRRPRRGRCRRHVRARPPGAGGCRSDAAGRRGAAPCRVHRVAAQPSWEADAAFDAVDPCWLPSVTRRRWPCGTHTLGAAARSSRVRWCSSSPVTTARTNVMIGRGGLLRLGTWCTTSLFTGVQRSPSAALIATPPVVPPRAVGRRKGGCCARRRPRGLQDAHLVLEARVPHEMAACAENAGGAFRRHAAVARRPPSCVASSSRSFGLELSSVPLGLAPGGSGEAGGDAL